MNNVINISKITNSFDNPFEDVLDSVNDETISVEEVKSLFEDLTVHGKSIMDRLNSSMGDRAEGWISSVVETINRPRCRRAIKHLH